MSEAENNYIGLKGWLKLKSAKKKAKKLEQGLSFEYDCQEAKQFMDQSVTWQESSRLIYLSSIILLKNKLAGLCDAGFIKLCKEWVVKNQVEVFNDEIVHSMLSAILPNDFYLELVNALKPKKRGGK